jgi:hypothetical protein
MPATTWPLLRRGGPLRLERRGIARRAVVGLQVDARALLGLRAGLLLVGRAAARVDAFVDLAVGEARDGEQEDGGLSSGSSGNDTAAGRGASRHGTMHRTMRSRPRGGPPRPSRRPRPGVAQALLAGFDKHYALFRECARAAKRHFEAGQFLSIGHAARDRIDFYDRRVSETAERLRREFGALGIEGAGADALWTRVRPHFVVLLAEHRQPECAETFFNSVSCRLLERDYFHNGAMFVRPAVATEYLDADEPAYRSYYPRERGLRTALIDLILDFRLERRFADFRGDLANVLAAFRRRLPRPFRLAASFQIQVLSSLFFRNRSAYIVGRVVNGAHTYPFAVSIRHASGGELYVDALLTDPVDLALCSAPTARTSWSTWRCRRRRSSSCARSCPTRPPPSSTRSWACRSTARRCSSATSCSTCGTRPTGSSRRPASAAS